MLDGLPTDTYSQARTHYCSTRGLLPAASPPWADTSLLRQPGGPALRRGHHIDAKLSADTRSTQSTDRQSPRPQTVHQSRPPEQLDYRSTPPLPVEKHATLMLVSFLQCHISIRQGRCLSYNDHMHQRTCRQMCVTKANSGSSWRSLLSTVHMVSADIQ